MAEVVLGIDVGTSGVRIVAVDRAGQQVGLGKAPITAPLQNFGRQWQDPELWWEAVSTALKLVDVRAHQVKALAIDGTSGTILAIDAKGQPQGLASMYNDVADKAFVDRVTAVAPEETAARGGSSPLARALEMEGRGARILHQADWLLGRLCGRFDVSDENNALKTGYDPVARQWPAWIGKTGLDQARLPEVRPVGTAIATLLPEMAQKFGLSADAMVVTGTTDGCAAFLASGARTAGDGVTSLGTTLTLKLLSATPVFAPRYGIYSHRIGDQWLAGGASNTGGGVLRKYFSDEALARLTPLLQPDVPTGLDYYPLSQAGERFPIADPDLAPRLEPRPADERVFLQGMLEGIAAVEALAYRRLAELGATPLSSIRTVGGGAQNAGWTKIRLKALGVPEQAPASEHAAAGAARLAWRGVGHAY